MRRRARRFFDHHRRVWLSAAAAITIATVVAAVRVAPASGARSSAHKSGLATSAQLPGDFEPLDELLIAWPIDDETIDFMTSVVAEASQSATIAILVVSDQDINSLRDWLVAEGALETALRFLVVEHQSVWVRDFGPLVVRRHRAGRASRSGRERVALDFDYFGDAADDDVPSGLSPSGQGTHRPIAVELEGGNLLSNGDGICVTTTVVITENGGPAKRPHLEAVLRAEVGCRRLVVLAPLAGESTGHADLFVSFVSKDHVLVGAYNPADDPINARILDSAAGQLARQGLRVTRVPMANNEDGVFRSYLNLAVVNDTVLVPVYANAFDDEDEALRIIGRAHAGRRVVAIDSTDIIELGGAIHCVTMNVAR